jgi:hypothetical protein
LYITLDKEIELWKEKKFCLIIDIMYLQ